MMVVALLGLGTVGRAVYDILEHQKKMPFHKTIFIKYILVRNKEKHKDIYQDKLVTDYQQILQDREVEVVIEMMGATISYEVIKKALLSSKHVITANKEVIAASYIELAELAKSKNVQLLFEAAVGGGIPIVHTLFTCAPYNEITKIQGLLNGTTNYILTSMHKNHMDFKEAVQMAQKLGFAEADPTADLEGLDMVRKIAILSMICFHTPISLEDIYHKGISNVTKDIVEIIELLGYRLKLMAFSMLERQQVIIGVEPVMIKQDALLANVDYEYNLVEYEGTACAKQTMSGKGAGPTTANSILFDMKLLSSGYQQRYAPTKKLKTIGNGNIIARYFIKPHSTIPSKWIEKNFKEFILTKKISAQELHALMPSIDFYARILE